MIKFKFKALTLFVLVSTAIDSQEVYEECSSIGCVHASAKLLSSIDKKIEP